MVRHLSCFPRLAQSQSLFLILSGFWPSAPGRSCQEAHSEPSLQGSDVFCGSREGKRLSGSEAKARIEQEEGSTGSPFLEPVEKLRLRTSKVYEFAGGRVGTRSLVLE